MSAPASATTDFAVPPDEPMGLVRAWFDGAVGHPASQPGAMALASADARGRASNRIVQVLAVRDAGLVFASHTGSRKGRELAETGWASGLLYWRELARQVVVAGPTAPLPDAESEELWAARPLGTHPMSTLSRQSSPLLDEDDLRGRALELGRAGSALPRPAAWVGYLLEPASVEFWESDPDRLHQRLRYERDGSGWRTTRLQP